MFGRRRKGERDGKPTDRRSSGGRSGAGAGAGAAGSGSGPAAGAGAAPGPGAGAGPSAGAPASAGSAARASRRHGRRAPRSSLTGAYLANPQARLTRFELDARGAVEFLRSALPEELAGVHIGYQTAPIGEGESQSPMFYSIDRDKKLIMLYRMPIQRAKGLHVDDAEHRRFFTEHCVYRAVCEYLGREPWELLPGRFDHY